MAYIAPFAESDFDSLHSSQAFVGDHQVMYTPPLRARKPSRFASTQSYVLPEIPNTSQIVGDGFGELPKQRPASNENQIIGAITKLQKQLDHAKLTIRDLIRERDEYRGECKALRHLLLQSQNTSQPKARATKPSRYVENDLFDLTQYSDAQDEASGRLPSVNFAKTKSSLRSNLDRIRAPQEIQQARATAIDPPTRLPHRQTSLSHQPQQSNRQPLREISESQAQQRMPPSPSRTGKKVVIETDYAYEIDEDIPIQTRALQPSQNITYLSNITDNQPFTNLRNQLEAERIARQQQKAKDQAREQDSLSKQDTIRSIRATTAPPAESRQTVAQHDDITAASNTSRRLRRRTASEVVELDENMTSGYILPDITVANPQRQRLPKAEAQPERNAELGQLSEEAKGVLHNVDPNHVVDCEHCRRLLKLPEKLQVRREAESWDWCMVLGSGK